MNRMEAEAKASVKIPFIPFIPVNSLLLEKNPAIMKVTFIGISLANER
ncbi:hypothetical protein KP004_12210 [Geomonas oryzisoli]|uniref:Uncharacterized protein n=1 Tax=Geomonas oryzisoli TaxID=2847992 RepID=A0ABX8J165_9BACT|nr:hypothetical protein [Geomonas oryzisoli]QWV91988.1 hypothetical protein KP004_12210 [Geomonas oryzisoli]